MYSTGAGEMSASVEHVTYSVYSETAMRAIQARVSQLGLHRA